MHCHGDVDSTSCCFRETARQRTLRGVDRPGAAASRRIGSARTEGSDLCLHHWQEARIFQGCNAMPDSRQVGLV